MKPYSPNRLSSVRARDDWEQTRGETRATIRRQEKKRARQSAQKEVRMETATIPELEELQAELLKRIPSLKIKVDREWLDIKLNSLHLTLRCYFNCGFGLWHQDLSYGSKPEELFDRGKEGQLVARVVELLLGVED